MNNKWHISDDYKEVSVEILTENLPSLRAKIAITQEEFANILGVSRQSYYSFETGKSKISWSLFLAIVFIFDSIEETSEMIRDLKIYPIDLFMRFNDMPIN